MPTTFTLTGDISVNIPAGWHELLLSHYIGLEELPKTESIFESRIMLLSVLSGVPLGTWLNIELNKINVAGLDQSIAWINKKVNWEKFPKPDEITIGEKKVKVPKMLELEKVGQHVAFEKMVYPLVEFNEDGSLKAIPASAYPIALAIYLQPAYFGGDFSSDDLEGFIELCKDIAFVEGVPLATFFLRSPYVSQLLNEIYNTRKMTNSQKPGSMSLVSSDSKT